MKISEIKNLLQSVKGLTFRLQNGDIVPNHFHVTEVGIITKDFIDCGGSVHKEKVANFQLWNANDHDHRLKAEKLLNIIVLSEKILEITDLEIEVVYQTETVGKYDLAFDGETFLLLSKHTVCLALDKCGVAEGKHKIGMKDLTLPAKICCTPGDACC
jgi:hypothetical protein